VPTGAWPLSAVDAVFLVLIPALVRLAFIRLFLVLTQSARGTLNVYGRSFQSVGLGSSGSAFACP